MAYPHQLFAIMTTKRFEIIEGSMDGKTWEDNINFILNLEMCLKDLGEFRLISLVLIGKRGFYSLLINPTGGFNVLC